MIVDRSVQYVARRTFGYDDVIEADRGMVFSLKGYPVDEKLVRLGYVEKVGKVSPVECNRCGKKFVDLGALNQHGRLRHPDEDIDEADLIERIEKAEAAAAPLYMDKTKATLDAAAATHDAQEAPKVVGRKRRFE